ncbi:hypothetical protein WA026_018399 [Henosepilachna vigintioctopunctata]|uniref:CDK5 regulatory subunit-associated protein 3 n=1 Tax=Henosepilachna vigintioctopunctata TaxID=420089 RepID=A0AAW1V1X6_9CUCU
MDEQSIPIDIHTNKLLEWLISRRHVKKEWQNNILGIREKINNAIQDMPAHEGIVKLLSGQHINYFHCRKIVDILKETEADTKNVFGRYGSQRMKDWQDILSCYQKDNVYLAEVSQILIRNVSYEIPSLRKQLSKLQQVELDCEKKIKDYTKSEVTCCKEFQTLCEQLGIPGKNIKNELMELVKDLPSIYEKSMQSLKEIEPAIDLYEAFNEYLSGNKIEVLKILRFVIEKGNTTTYEYLHGKKPIKIDLPEIKSPSEGTENTSSNEIDFGDDIDFGVVNESIDFDISSNDDNIDWSVKTDDEFEIIEHSDANSKIIELDIESTSDDGIATGVDALTLLDNPSTRENILNTLLELESFLKMRTLEMMNESDLLSMSQLQNASSIIQMQTLETIGSLSIKVDNALKDLLNKRTQHLHNLKHSINYVDILTSNLNQKLSQVDRMKACKILMENKISESRKEAGDVENIVALLINKTKDLQNDIQNDISQKYKGRVVNIVGGVNMI